MDGRWWKWQPTVAADNDGQQRMVEVGSLPTVVMAAKDGGQRWQTTDDVNGGWVELAGNDRLREEDGRPGRETDIGAEGRHMALLSPTLSHSQGGGAP